MVDFSISGHWWTGTCSSNPGPDYIPNGTALGGTLKLPAITILLASTFAAVGCAEPAKVELVGQLAPQVTDLERLLLPAAVVKDADGRILAGETATVSIAPLGIAELDGTAIVPRARGDLTITWATRNGRTITRTVLIRPVDRVVLRCSPCRAVVGERVKIQATAYSGDTIVDVEVPLSTTGPSAELREHDVMALAAGSQVIKGELGAISDQVTVEVRARPDSVDVVCPTIFTKTALPDGGEMDVCYMTQFHSLRFDAFALASGKRMPDEHVRYDVLNTKVADVGVDGTVIAGAVGQTALKVSLSSNPYVFKQISLYVDGPRIAEKFRRMMRRPVGQYYSTATGRAYQFYSPSCRSWTGFSVSAFARTPDTVEPEQLVCESSEAIACAAEASRHLKVLGRSSAENIRSWLGPCCCLTVADRDFLAGEVEKRRGGQ